MCPLLYQPVLQYPFLLLLSTKSWKGSGEAEGIQSLAQDLPLSKAILELDSIVGTDDKILLEYLGNCGLLFFHSLMLPINPEDQTAIIKQPTTLLIPTNNWRAVNQLSCKDLKPSPA